MKNKPVIIGIVILFLSIIGFDQFSKYLLRQKSDAKNDQYNKTMNLVDNTMISVDNQINKWKNLERNQQYSNCMIDSLTNELQRKRTDIQYIYDTQIEYVDKIQYVHKSVHIEAVERFVQEYQDSIQYSYIIKDSIIYKYDTVQVIYVDSVIITDDKTKTKNKIKKKKYLD